MGDSSSNQQKTVTRGTNDEGSREKIKYKKRLSLLQPVSSSSTDATATTTSAGSSVSDMSGWEADDSWSFNEFDECESPSAITTTTATTVTTNATVATAVAVPTSGGMLPKSSVPVPSSLKNMKRVASWSVEEDRRLLEIVREVGSEGNWSTVSSKMETLRTGKQCRERYLNHLKPDIRKDPWTEEEDDLLIQLYHEHGSRWSKFMPFLHGRSDNSIKNRFHVLNRNYGGCFLAANNQGKVSSNTTSSLRKERTRMKVSAPIAEEEGEEEEEDECEGETEAVVGNEDSEEDQAAGEQTPSKRQRSLLPPSKLLLSDMNAANASMSGTRSLAAAAAALAAVAAKASGNISSPMATTPTASSTKAVKSKGSSNKKGKNKFSSSSPKAPITAVSPMVHQPSYSSLFSSYGITGTASSSANASVSSGIPSLPPISALTTAMHRSASYDSLMSNGPPVASSQSIGGIGSVGGGSTGAVTVITPIPACLAAGFTSSSSSVAAPFATAAMGTKTVQLLAQVIPVQSIPLPDPVAIAAASAGHENIMTSSTMPSQPRESLFNIVVNGKPYDPMGRRTTALPQSQSESLHSLTGTEIGDESWDFAADLGDNDESIEAVLMMVEEDLAKSDQALNDALYASPPDSEPSPTTWISSAKKRQLSLSAVQREDIKSGRRGSVLQSIVETEGNTPSAYLQDRPVKRMGANDHFGRNTTRDSSSKQAGRERGDPLNELLWNMDDIAMEEHDEDDDNDNDNEDLAFVYQDSKAVSDEARRRGFRHSFSSTTSDSSSDGCELLSPIIRLLQRGSIDSLCLSVDNNNNNATNTGHHELDSTSFDLSQHSRGGAGVVPMRRPSVFNSNSSASETYQDDSKQRRSFNAGSGLLPDVITNDYPATNPMLLSPNASSLSPSTIVPPVPTIVPATAYDSHEYGGSESGSASTSSFCYPPYSPVFPSSFLSSLASPSFAAASASSATTPVASTFGGRPVFGRTSFPAAVGYPPDLLSTYFRVPANMNASVGTMFGRSMSGGDVASLSTSSGNGHPLALAVPGIVAVPSYDPLPSPSFATGLRHSFSVPLASTSSSSDHQLVAVPTLDLSSAADPMMIDASNPHGGRSGMSGTGLKKDKHNQDIHIQYQKKGGALTMRDIEQARLAAVRRVEKAMRDT